jgi:hypothetical protein
MVRPGFLNFPFPPNPVNLAEKKIYSALKLAAAAIRDDGLEPDEALTKAASSAELNPEMTRRTAEMLNISLTRAHFQSGGDKTASFPLASAETVIDRVFRDRPVDNVPEPKQAGPMTPGDRFLARLRGEGGFSFSRSEVKAAGADANANTPPRHAPDSFWSRLSAPRAVAPPRDVRHEIRNAERARGEVKQAADRARLDASSAFSRMAETLQELVRHFDRVDEIPKYAAFENQAYGEYGDAAEPWLAFVRVQLPQIAARGERERFAKSARRWEPNPVNALLDAFIDQTEAYRAAQRVSDETSADANRKIAALDAAYHLLAGVDPAPAPAPGDLLNFNARYAVPIRKGAAMDETLGRLRTLIGIPDHGDLARQAVETHISDRYAKGQQAQEHMTYKAPIEAADHEMNNVRREAILRDLLSNDEIISHHDPHHIQSAYNGLLSIAPEATTNREVLRAFLRNATAQQAIDPFQAKQLADLGNVTLKNQNLRSGKSEHGVPN